ncbi:GlxA family transcriptional regulator [Kutzneria kofuensis]|uniref:Transcriptional regulator GlxA family with amidase domain n=1 Tax=Kutzneria kofuensis TaxID=103725 RepID=A0A7W9KEC4_9PSEU|nr:helix-turn-helix domain-containing protein [Kutzneria kofuensis]MBB5891059.1 transcriptional regulator GlxA family with amidase domain [Kutzneria kofuensis]
MHPVKSPPLSRGRDRHVIAVPVLPDSVALEVTVVQQVFGRRPFPGAGDLTGRYQIVLCGERRRQPLPGGVDLGDLAPLETLLTADTVLVPGVENPFAPRSRTLLATLRAAFHRGARMVGLCGGTFLLGRAGVLDGRRATTHWLYSAAFREAFPLTRLEIDRVFVDDGSVHTCGGALSTADIALHLLSLDIGDAYADAIGRLLVVAPHRSGEQLARDPHGQFMTDFLSWLREHVHEPLTLTRLAGQAHVSERSLVRKFRQATGTSIFEWIGQERVERAKSLLETTDHLVADIAAMAGFGSAESLRRNFVKHVGISARSYRAKFRPTRKSGGSHG